MSKQIQETTATQSSVSRWWRKLPIVIEAERWDGGDTKPLDYFLGQNWTRADARDVPWIHDDGDQIVIWNEPEGTWIPLPVGHWIILCVKGEFYTCAPDIFAATYESLADREQTFVASGGGGGRSTAAAHAPESEQIMLAAIQTIAFSSNCDPREVALDTLHTLGFMAMPDLHTGDPVASEGDAS